MAKIENYDNYVALEFDDEDKFELVDFLKFFTDGIQRFGKSNGMMIFSEEREKVTFLISKDE